MAKGKSSKKRTVQVAADGKMAKLISKPALIISLFH